MPRVLTALFFASACVACGGSTVLHDDRADGTDAAPAAPGPEPVARRATLSCSYAFAEGLDLATGEVRVVRDGELDVDVECDIGRYVVLSGRGICRVGDVTPAPSPIFDDVSAVPGDPTACRCDQGNCWLGNQLCGLVTTPYSPACVGVGLVLRDRSHQSTWTALIVKESMSAAPDNVASITFDYLRAR